MDSMLFEIVEEEGLARELAELAYELAQEGFETTAQAVRDLCRKSRVKGLELRGNFEALRTAAVTAKPERE